MTRIKCCGMTRVEDALLAARLGADAIGLVFTARSKRQVTLARAREIVAALPPFITTVALFMDDAAALVRQVVDEVDPALLQFHGDEDDDWCARFDRPFVKAIAMGDGAAALRTTSPFPFAWIHFARGLLWSEFAGDARRGEAAYDLALAYPGHDESFRPAIHFTMTTDGSIKMGHVTQVTPLKP